MRRGGIRRRTEMRKDDKTRMDKWQKVDIEKSVWEKAAQNTHTHTNTLPTEPLKIACKW